MTFTDGSWFRYDYNAAGEKLKAYYHIGEDLIVVPGPPIGVAPDPVNSLSAGTQGVTDAAGMPGSTLAGNVRDSIEYCGNMLYENGKLDKVFVDGGYATLSTAGVPTYHFYVKDHLGSIRRIVRQDGTVERTNHYYPYGGLHGESGGTTAHRFRFTGKEYDPMNGLNWYDFGARTMAPDLIRFLQPDPLAEKYYCISPYTYCMGNPVKYVDPKGKDSVNLLPPSTSDERTPYLNLDIDKFIDDPNVINIWAHGDKTGINDGSTGENITSAEDFEEMLNQHSEVWANKKDGEKVTIVLHSCETKEFAEKISKDERFNDVTIIAPNKKVQVRHEKGTMTYISTGVAETTEHGVKIGAWFSYVNGQLQAKYSGDFKSDSSKKPGGLGFSYGNKLTNFLSIYIY